MKTLQDNQDIELGKCTVDEGRTSGQQPGGRWFKSNPRHQETNEGRIALKSILPSSFLLSYLPVLEYHCAIALSVVLRDCVVVV